MLQVTRGLKVLNVNAKNKWEEEEKKRFFDTYGYSKFFSSCFILILIKPLLAGSFSLWRYCRIYS